MTDALELFAKSAIRDGICIGVVLLHAGIVQEANLSMLHLASNKASEQHILWQVCHSHLMTLQFAH